MSQRTYAAPLQITLEPSRRLALLLMASAAGAVILPLAVPLPWIGRLAILFAVAASFQTVYRHQYARRRVVQLIWDEDGQWKLSRADGTEFDAVLRGDSVVASWLVLLNFDVGRQVVSVPLLWDSTDKESLRRLRVRLKLQGAKTADAADPSGLR